jgi:hypothetical protein
LLESYTMLVKAQPPDAPSPSFGHSRYVNVREAAGSITFDEEMGCNRIVYNVETDRGFFKMTFVADQKCIYVSDVFQ